mgnify:CR=1 FL=1
MTRKKKEYLFVDGYNIINQWDYLRKSLDNIEECRNKLIDDLVEYQVFKGIHVIVVFDAHLVKGNSEKKEYKAGLEIVYTKESETADSYIEKQLDKIGRYEKVQVATSDNCVQQIVLARGGTRLSARELYLEIKDTKKEIRRKTDKIINNNTNIEQIIDRKTLKKLEKIRRLPR